MASSDSNYSERRRYRRLPVEGRAQIFFQGETMVSGLRDASFKGAMVEIIAETLKLKQNDFVVIQPLIKGRSIAFICAVRHISIRQDEKTQNTVFTVGLEHAAPDGSDLDLLSLLINTGVARLTTEFDPAESVESLCRNGSTLNLLREGIRQSSITRILSPEQPPPEIGEILDDDGSLLVKDLWKVSISIDSAAMNIKFHAHYRVEEARIFIQSKNSRRDSEINDHLIHDYMREFCNLTAGAVKSWISKHCSEHLSVKDLRVQLPVQGDAKHRDVETVPTLDFATHVQDEWQLNLPSGEFFRCSTEITIWDWAAVASMAAQEELSEAPLDGVEFL